MEEKINMKIYKIYSKEKKFQTEKKVAPGEGQICQCLRKGQLCSAWCHLLPPLPPWLLQCLRPCLAAKLQAHYTKITMEIMISF